MTIGVGGPRVILAGDVGTVQRRAAEPEQPRHALRLLPGRHPRDGDEPVRLQPAVRPLHLQRAAAGPTGPRRTCLGDLDSTVNTTGTVLAPGYLFDEAANGFSGFTFNLATYPGLRELHDRAFEALQARIYAAFPDLAAQGVLDRGPAGLDEIYPGLTRRSTTSSAPCPSDVRDPVHPVPLPPGGGGDGDDARRVHRPRDGARPRRCAQAILADNDRGRRRRSLTLAADRDAWRDLSWPRSSRPACSGRRTPLPPIRDRPKIVSLMATLAAGILIGPAGKEIVSTGNLADFFERIRTWYGNNPGLLGARSRATTTAYERLPRATSRSRRCRRSTSTTSACRSRRTSRRSASTCRGSRSRIAAPACRPTSRSTARSRRDGSPFSPLDLTAYLQGNAAQGLASITGPQTVETGGWLPLGEDAAVHGQLRRTPRRPRSTSPRCASSPSWTTNLDIFSFRLGDIKVGKINLHLPAGRALFQGDFDFTQTLGFILRVSAGADQYEHEATWLLAGDRPADRRADPGPDEGPAAAEQRPGRRRRLRQLHHPARRARWPHGQPGQGLGARALQQRAAGRHARARRSKSTPRRRSRR